MQNNKGLRMIFFTYITARKVNWWHSIQVSVRREREMWGKKSTKRWMCEVSGAELSGWAGGGERWGASWWDIEQHLSPINSLYWSLSFCVITTYSHCLAVWSLHPFCFFLMKILSPCRSVFVFFASGKALFWKVSHHFTRCNFILFI